MLKWFNLNERLVYTSHDWILIFIVRVNRDFEFQTNQDLDLMWEILLMQTQIVCLQNSIFSVCLFLTENTPNTSLVHALAVYLVF